MSKGHVDALRAMREAKAARPATKPPRPVTKISPINVTASKHGRGRPKVHASAADRQRACRSRKAQSHVKA